MVMAPVDSEKRFEKCQRRSFARLVGDRRHEQRDVKKEASLAADAATSILICDHNEDYRIGGGWQKKVCYLSLLFLLHSA